MKLVAIGIIRTPHRQAEGTPVQAALAGNVAGSVELLPEYEAGPRYLAGFDRIWLVDS